MANDDEDGDGSRLHEPFYIRPPDFRYCLRTNPAYGWATGIAADGAQVLHCRRHWLVFDRDGTLLRTGEQGVPFRDGPIAVRRFWLPDRWIGVEDYDLDEDEDEGEPGPGQLDSWLRAGQFVFYPGWGDYIMGPGGRVEAS